jgi:hypothetical protein
MASAVSVSPATSAAAPCRGWFICCTCVHVPLHVGHDFECHRGGEVTLFPIIPAAQHVAVDSAASASMAFTRHVLALHARCLSFFHIVKANLCELDQPPQLQLSRPGPPRGGAHFRPQTHMHASRRPATDSTDPHAVHNCTQPKSHWTLAYNNRNHCGLHSSNGGWDVRQGT